KQLADDVMQIAGALRERGVQPGDCVVLRLLNRPQFISTFLAVLRIGAVAVPTPPLIRSRELGTIIENADPVLLVSEAGLGAEVEKLSSAPVPRLRVESLSAAPPYRECAPTAKDAPAIIL